MKTLLLYSHSMLEANILYRQTNSIASQINYEIPFNQIQVGGIIGQGPFYFFMQL